MPWHRIVNVFDLEQIVWENWPKFGINQFLSQPEDRIRLETQNRLPQHGNAPAEHVHNHADTVHVVLEGEGEYAIAPDVWVPAKRGDIFLTRGGHVHGGRGTNPDKPLKYLVLEGPAPEDLTLRNPDLHTGIATDGTSDWGVTEQWDENGRRRTGFNGGIPGTNILLGGPSDRPSWMDHLPDSSYTD